MSVCVLTPRLPRANVWNGNVILGSKITIFPKRSTEQFHIALVTIQLATEAWSTSKSSQILSEFFTLKNEVDHYKCSIQSCSGHKNFFKPLAWSPIASHLAKIVPASWKALQVSKHQCGIHSWNHQTTTCRNARWKNTQSKTNCSNRSRGWYPRSSLIDDTWQTNHSNKGQSPWSPLINSQCSAHGATGSGATSSHNIKCHTQAKQPKRLILTQNSEMYQSAANSPVKKVAVTKPLQSSWKSTVRRNEYIPR